ncbi:hypothetical protein ACJX0J_027424, partial [Zea mays]
VTIGEQPLLSVVALKPFGTSKPFGAMFISEQLYLGCHGWGADFMFRKLLKIQNWKERKHRTPHNKLGELGSVLYNGRFRKLKGSPTTFSLPVPAGVQAGEVANHAIFLEYNRSIICLFIYQFLLNYQ